LNWGTANAVPVALSFWARASVAGTYSGSIRNTGFARSYVYTFALAANTWTQVQLSIPGDTAGTWTQTTNYGILLDFDYGTGSNYTSPTANTWLSASAAGLTGGLALIKTLGSTLDFTGVQFEASPVATSFDYVPYPAQLEMCQRYFQKSFAQGTKPAQGVGVGTGEQGTVAVLAAASSIVFPSTPFVVPMRAAPTITTYNPASANSSARDISGAVDCTGASAQNVSDRQMILTTTGNAATAVGNQIRVHWTASAVLNP
jgi:hypothetical protein